jgi:hypothetical protein
MSSRKNRQNELRATKERRQKKIAIGGAVLLAVVLAIQVPRLMNRGGSPAPATGAAATTAAVTTTDATTPTPAAGGTAAAPTAPTAGATSTATGSPTPHTKLPDSDLAPTRLRSQLASFELFDSKDPFVQQVSSETAQTTAVAPTSSGSATPTTSGTTATPGTPPPSSTTPPTTQPPVARTLAHQLSAAIEVNGKPERVAVGGAFPSSNPTFKLVSLANGIAMIGIAGGAYASGAQTIALQQGRTLTLVDTSSGLRYELRLVSIS